LRRRTTGKNAERLSTLCKYGEALGARCDVAFVFPDGRHLLVEVKADEPHR
jgi:hypothetical protein